MIMAENINSRLNKKVFVVREVYDTTTKIDQEITDAVQKDLDEYIGKGMVSFGFYTSPNMISLVFIRFTEYYKQNNVDLKKDMVDADAFMVTGEGFGGFKMPVKFPIAPFGYTPYLMGQSDFKTAYKDSAELLGADKVNWMKMEVTPHSVVIRLK